MKETLFKMFLLVNFIIVSAAFIYGLMNLLGLIPGILTLGFIISVCGVIVAPDGFIPCK